MTPEEQIQWLLDQMLWCRDRIAESRTDIQRNNWITYLEELRADIKDLSKHVKGKKKK